MGYSKSNENVNMDWSKWSYCGRNEVRSALIRPTIERFEIKFRVTKTC
jgi:hypothetical protein